jgi:Glycosyl transferases group 1
VPLALLFVANHAPACEDAYARRLAATLALPVVPLWGRAPMPDEAAYEAARVAWDALAPETQPLIAGPALPAFAPLAHLFPARRAVALIHRPLAGLAGPPEPERQWLAAVDRQMLGLMPLIVASSQAVADAVSAEASVPPARIVVVEPPTPELVRARGSAGAGTAILSKGALVRANAHDVLLAALAGLPDLDWRLCIVGSRTADPEHAAELKALAERLGLAPRVRFAGQTDASELEELWQEADLFALAGAGPGYGMATAAALKRGLPVAICGDGAIAPAIPPVAGAIAPPGNTVQLGKALRRLIFDRSLRGEMAEAAWQAGQALPEREATAARFGAALERSAPA